MKLRSLVNVIVKQSLRSSYIYRRLLDFSRFCTEIFIANSRKDEETAPHKEICRLNLAISRLNRARFGNYGRVKYGMKHLNALDDLL